jgi:hypothetical protein
LRVAKAKIEYVLQPHISVNFMLSPDASPTTTSNTDGIATGSMGFPHCAWFHGFGNNKVSTASISRLIKN